MTRDDRIRLRSYDIWQREGRPDGRHEQHWIVATREIDEEDAAERRRETDRRLDRSTSAVGRSPREPPRRLSASG